MRKAAVPRNAIFLRGIKTAIGKLKRSRPNFGISTRRTLRPERMCVSTPLLDWTELNIWEYIERENIPTVSLYYDQGSGKRYRSLGCWPCTSPVDSTATNVNEIIAELKTGKFANVAERSGRAQDKEDGGGLEGLRREGYM